MKTAFKLFSTLIAFCLLGLIIAWLTGTFNEKILPEKVDIQKSMNEGHYVVTKSIVEATSETATGTINARDETSVSSRILANIQSIHVRAGDTVRKGDVVIELDARQLKARVEQARQTLASAQATLNETKAEFKRIQTLYERKIVARAEYDRTDATLKSRQAEYQRSLRLLEEAKTALSFTKIKSPIDGKVIERYAEPGDTASPGLPLVKIYNPSLLRLDAQVRETLAARIKLGDTLEVYIDAIKMNLSVTVDEIVPSADPGTRSVTVKSVLPTNPMLYPGMFGRLKISTGEVERIYVPENAINRVGQLEFIEVIENNEPVKRFIRTGRRNEKGQAEVLSGLQTGETFLIKQTTAQ